MSGRGIQKMRWRLPRNKSTDWQRKRNGGRQMEGEVGLLMEGVRGGYVSLWSRQWGRRSPHWIH